MNDANGRPVILCQTGYDESFLLGTREQLADFANGVLRLLEQPKQDSTWFETPVKFSDATLTENRVDVVIDGIVVVETEDDRRQLTNAIRGDTGDSLIDFGD